MKNISSRIIAIILLIAVSPFLVILILMIRVESKGHPLFKQNRVGKGGKIFIIYKLRTMKEEQKPEYVSYVKLSVYESCLKCFVTRIGNLLRKYHIDEIPQLWNIIKNEMAFVGPRPFSIPRASRAYYAPRDENIIPGLTGLAQISLLRETEGYDTLKLDKFYCKKRSFLLNLQIVFLTLIRVIFFKKV